MDSAYVQDCSDVNSHGKNMVQYATHTIHDNTGNPQHQKTGCVNHPCRNDGHCFPLSPTEYKCSCINGYV